METPATPIGYSAKVKLELRVDHRTFELASVGPNKCVLRDGVELPPCKAEIAMFVDDWLYIWPIRLPHGTVPFERDVQTQSAGEMRRCGPVAHGNRASDLNPGVV